MACDDLRRNQRLLGPLQNALGGQQRLLAPSVALAGTRLGKYEVLGLLGRGGMATVYRAVQNHPHRDVALKVMKYDLPPGTAAL
jgi:serine/threonine protein kinase